MLNKNTKTIVGILAGFLILGAAAFIGGRLLNGKSSGLGQIFNFGNNAMSMTSFEMEPSPLLPKTNPLIYGTFAERKDNTIYVQTFSTDAVNGGGVIIVSTSGDSGSGETTANISGNNGPKVEVVITKDTKIYKDVTEINFDNQANQTAQQELEEGSIDDLSKNSMLTVWGRKVGDRTIAEFIVVTNTMMISKP